MLATQVQYWTLQEGKRHNKVVEDQGQQSINEGIRHNKKTEAQTDWLNAEVQRHNKKTESLTEWMNKEVGRHNKATEAIGWHTAQSNRIQANAAASQAAAAHKQAANSAIMANAAQKQAQAALQNANSTQGRYESQNKVDKSTINKNKHTIGQGWVNAGANVVNSLSSAIRARRGMAMGGFK